MKIFDGDVGTLPEPMPGFADGDSVEEDVYIETESGFRQLAAAGVAYHPKFIAALEKSVKQLNGKPKGGETKKIEPKENK